MAPVGLDSVQDFVNTEDRRAGTEILDSVENLGLWLAKWGLAPRGTELTPADLERMLHLRRDLRRWIAGGRTGRMDPAVAERLTRWSEPAVFHPRFDPVDGLVIEPSAEGFAGALGRLCERIARAQADGTWSRLKLCAHRECSRVFYDRSPNRSRRWCSMGTCGNRAKGKTYRRRNRCVRPKSF